eukprot:gene12157-13411_t
MDIRKLAEENGLCLKDERFAKLLDDQDELKSFRSEFHYPKNKTLPRVDLSLVNAEDECIYLCNNSLGLMPKKAEDAIKTELTKWAEMGVWGHTNGKYPWQSIEDFCVEPMARIVGAKPIEVALMNSLTVNLHLLMVPFYRPTQTRYKILIEDQAFPSDHYAVQSQIHFHGYDPKDALILAKRRKGEESWREKDIIDLIEKEGDSIALILFSGVHYYSGQVFDMKSITEAGHKKGCVVGFDLAHAVGNVELKLDDWNVDFAAWCTYKYLNSGAGGIAGIYVNEKHTNDDSLPRFRGWWGHELKTRFVMDNNLMSSPGAAGFQISNSGFAFPAILITSLEIFDRARMDRLRKKSLLLTGYLDCLLDEAFGCNGEHSHILKTTVITPSDLSQRGCQLSVKFSIPVHKLMPELNKRGIVCDERKPDVLRLAPVPLVNKFHDVWLFIQLLADAAKAASNK